MITVYQADWQRLSAEEVGSLLLGSPETVLGVWERGLYREVATVHAGDLDEAYAHTNTMTGCWSANPANDPEGQKRDVRVDVVDWAAEGGCRSTSVGDVMLSCGQYQVVASFGFKPIDLPDLGRGVQGHRAAALEAYDKLMTVDWAKLGFPGLADVIPWGDLRAAAGKDA